MKRVADESMLQKDCREEQINSEKASSSLYQTKAMTSHPLDDIVTRVHSMDMKQEQQTCSLPVLQG